MDEIHQTIPASDSIRRAQLAKQLQEPPQRTAESIAAVRAVRDERPPTSRRGKDCWPRCRGTCPGLSVAARASPSSSRMRLDRFADDPHLADLKPQIEFLRDDVRAVVPEDIPREIAPYAASPADRINRPGSASLADAGGPLPVENGPNVQPTPEAIVHLVLLSVLSLCFAPLLCLIRAWVFQAAARWAQGLELSFGEPTSRRFTSP